MRVGSVQQTKGTTYTVSKVHVHESFNYDQLSNDLALLTLSGPLQQGPTVVAADLPGPCLLPTGHSATVAGWGRTATHQNRTVDFSAKICDQALNLLKGQCHEIFDFWFFS